MMSGNKIKSGFIKLLFLIVVFAMIGIVVSAQVPPPLNDVSTEVSPAQQSGTPGDVLTYNISLTNDGTVPDINVVDSITGVPSGWTFELRDAGVPQTLPYQTPLLASKTNHSLTLYMRIPANATADAAMTVNIHSYASHSVTDSDTFECLITPEEQVHRPGGGGDGTYPPGWFETPTPSAATTPAESPTPEPTETPAITPAETPTPAPVVSPTETPTTKLPTKGIPGFESVYMIAGILAAAYLMLRRR